jgi:oxamate amidohydrolase
MDLYTAGHRRGVVAAPHHAAVEAGRAVLAEGGNALEAMVAMAATIAVVYPHMAQMGGDGFWLMRQPSGRPRALMAAGRSGANARRELYRDYETIPPRGPLAALTVPGAIAGWKLALEAASACGGRMRLCDLLAPAIARAKAGAMVTRGQARLTAETLAELEHRLRAAGHDVEVLPETYSDVMGHADAIVLHPDGTFESGHDPRADGGAAGV